MSDFMKEVCSSVAVALGRAATRTATGKLRGAMEKRGVDVEDLNALNTVERNALAIVDDGSIRLGERTAAKLDAAFEKAKTKATRRRQLRKARRSK